MSDFPEFDEAYLRMMLPENPDQFDILAAKANFGIYRHDLWHGTGRRFAELIVRECADVGSKFSMAHPEDIRYQIKRHFGVEE